jgi:hypothetical protein
MGLAIAVSSPRSEIAMDTLADSAMDGVPIEKDFVAIKESDQVIFQDKEARSPEFKNQRALEYEQYVKQQGATVPVRVWNDISVYPIHCLP